MKFPTLIVPANTHNYVSVFYSEYKVILPYSSYIRKK